MRGVNKVILVATAGADAELRHTGSGTAVCGLRLATNESWTDKQSGEKQERTEWHKIKIFGKLAEIAGEYVKKGKQVYIEGQLRTEKYTDKEGVERYATVIIADQMQLLGGGDGQQRNQGSGQSNQSRSQNHGSAANRGSSRNDNSQQGGDRQEQSHADSSFGFSDEEIPFRNDHRSYL
ncbi:MAG: single-stranded DNA-binding protein [Rhodanobacter sp.]